MINKEIIETLEGKYIYKPNFTVSSKWVEIYDIETYDIIYNTIKQFIKDEKEGFDEYVLQDFVDGKWMINYQFEVKKVNLKRYIEVIVKAEQDKVKVKNGKSWLVKLISEDDLNDTKVNKVCTNYAKMVEQELIYKKAKLRNKKKRVQSIVDELYIEGEINIDFIEDDINLGLLQEILLEEYGIDTEIENQMLINLSTESEVEWERRWMETIEKFQEVMED